METIAQDWNAEGCGRIMAKREESSGGRVRIIRLGFKILIVLAALVVIGIIGLLILSALVNRSGRIPEAMRKAPAAMVKLRRQPANPQATRSPSPAAAPLASPVAAPSSHAALSNSEPPGQGLNGAGWLWDYQQKFRAIGVPVTAEQATWLQAHAKLLERLHFLTRAESRSQLAASFAALHIPGGSETYLGYWTGLLAQEAQWRMQQDDFAGAHDGFLDAWRLLDAGFQAGVSRATIIDCLYVTCLHLVNGIENPQWPNGQWGGIPEALEALDAKLFNAPDVQDEVVETYFALRSKMIENLDGSWSSPFFLHGDIHGRAFYVQTGFYWPNTNQEIELPRPFKLMDTASKAMALKRRSAELLGIFDADWQWAIDLSRMTYPEKLAALKKGKRAAFTGSITLDNAKLAARAFEQNETLVHLTRVGLLWRLDPQRARTLRSEPLPGHPHHAWRDPFSEQPFQLDETASGTVIFSIGYTSVSPALKPSDGRRMPGFHIKLPPAPSIHH